MTHATSFRKAGIATCLLLVLGCGPQPDSNESEPTVGSEPAASEPTSSLVGKIEIDGSSTVQPISNAIREAFVAQHPGVSINVLGNGTGNGFKKFQEKETDISDASRPIKGSEFAKCAANGVAFIELPVAYDGLTIVVHPANDWVQELTIDQLQQMFVGDDAATQWKDIDESWPAEDINIFAPGTGSGTYDYFHEVLAKQDDAELRGDMNLNEDDNVLVQGVAGNKYSIGFFGVAYYEENKDKLRAVPVVNPADQTAYLPTSDNIAANLYAPFSRPLFIYVNAQSLNRAEVQTFVEYYMENTSEYCEKVGYVRLPAEIIEAGRANLDARQTGTHFVDAEGNSRSGSLSSLFKPENLVTIEALQ